MLNFLKNFVSNESSFHISEKDAKKINEWLHKEVYPIILEKQKENEETRKLITKDDDGKEYPYAGAIGGELTYSFTNTSLGTVFKVKAYGKTLDLTDYDMW